MNTAVVTGAGSGVGRAVALKFAREGWNAALVGRHAEPLSATAGLAGPAAGDRLAVFPCDVSVAGEVGAIGTAVLARIGEVEVLVNAAGTNIPMRRLELLSIEDWHFVLATNL